MYAHVYLGGDCIYSIKIENKTVGCSLNPLSKNKPETFILRVGDLAIPGIVPVPRPDMEALMIQTHTGEKPFPSRFAGCSRSGVFSVKSNQTRHEGKHVRENMPVPLKVLEELNAKRAKRHGEPPLTMQGSS